MYQVIDRVTKQAMGNPLATRKAASRKVDKLDSAYGGYRYSIVKI